MFLNDFLSSEFSAYETTILKTSKTIKGNFGISEKCRVPEKKCRGAGRNIPYTVTIWAL